MGNTSCRTCLEKGVDATANAWWHKAAHIKSAVEILAMIHPFKPESDRDFRRRMKRQVEDPR
jgi:hypothetical protein